jgi:DNA-binding HxlR family transcriptional regulator/putative sterol carrier protein
MTRRDYRQYCGLAVALDVLGERWTLLIVRELLLGPRRYGELLAELPGIGTNLLAERLKFLVERGVLQHASADGRERAYELTELGEELRKPVLGLARWGLAQLGEPSDTEMVMRPHWGFLAVQAMMDGERVSEVDEAYEFHVDDVVFHIWVHDQVPQAFQGTFPGIPAMTAHTDSPTFLEIGAKHLSPFEALASGRLSIDGDPAATMRCSYLLGLVTAPALERGSAA